MTLTEFIRQMPKVELHVHLEGAVRPETLLKLAHRNEVALPADTVEGLREWYRFINFPHFVEVYTRLSDCIRTAADIELIAREFLEGQAAQNIHYSEVTYTAYTHYLQKGIDFADQLAALNRARAWGESELGVRMNLIIDIPREVSPEQGRLTAGWAIRAHGHGVVALGLGGYEVGNPPGKFADSFQMAARAGLPAVPHAGETSGPESIWGALRELSAVRIGHGVRCLDDPTLVEELRERQIPLEVCPTSNLCLGVAPDLAGHPLPKLIDAGLYVTINSDDPPLFNTTLTDEYLKIAAAYGYDQAMIEKLGMNAVHVTLLEEADKGAMIKAFEGEFTRLKAAV
jgi:adenosine deaminase